MSDVHSSKKRWWSPCSWFRHSSGVEAEPHTQTEHSESLSEATKPTWHALQSAAHPGTADADADANTSTGTDSGATASADTEAGATAEAAADSETAPSSPTSATTLSATPPEFAGTMSAASFDANAHAHRLPEESRRVLEKAHEVFSHLPGPVAPED